MSFGSQAINEYRQVRVHSSVQNAAPHRLVAMLFEGVVEKVLGARLRMMHGGNPAEKGELLSGAIAIIEALRASLDQEQGGEIARNLDALYDYMARRLLEANLRNDVAALDEVVLLIKGIAEAWAAITPVARSVEPEAPMRVLSVGA